MNLHQQFRLLLGDAFPNKELSGGALLRYKFTISTLVCSRQVLLLAALCDLSAMLFLLKVVITPPRSLLLRLLLGDAFPNKELLGGALLH